MQVFFEIDRRIEAARKLLALEELHLERVRMASLDHGTAMDLVIKQRRHLNCLIAQRERVVAHQGVPHPARKPPASALADQPAQ